MYMVARFFIVLGVLFIALGIVVYLLPGLANFHLPGDIVIRRNNAVFYFPIITSLVLSVLLTILLNILGRK
ncbi:MAG: DUF2905 domain-containing protein [candidate division WOR-3 bacterium]|nr:MAG: DUF2905 domain-containing protein [candidate division WOR-3 bacterium]